MPLRNTVLTRDYVCVPVQLLNSGIPVQPLLMPLQKGRLSQQGVFLGQLSLLHGLGKLGDLDQRLQTLDFVLF
jgi:hypothetical protein